MYIHICARPENHKRQAVVAFYYVPKAFLCVATYFSQQFVENIYVPIRSVQTSRNSVKALYVPTCSYYVPPNFFKILLQGYTFLYVLCNPSVKLQRCYTFLYVLVTFVYVPPYFSQDLTKSDMFLYVPCNPSIEMHKCYTFLYVPNAFSLIFRTILRRCNLLTSIMHLLLRSYTFLIRSYTFREALSLWDLLAPAAPGVDSGFWGTSHKTWPRLNQIVGFR